MRMIMEQDWHTYWVALIISFSMMSQIFSLQRGLPTPEQNFPIDRLTPISAMQETSCWKIS
ncbi:hypothetical protein CUJ84_pRLN3000197 (plasmid) [Rhizobium leguminosarum]|uniref:Uncharacterized protein n=1 Tax=Rhizobium leguminosarum TaxID=384 RepID=A0A2K9ZGD9_RHILE|nr:hypothetical protein CUJ84_pRLN3000197 [Rhizobium leguminosarum]